jgi:cytochrome P450/deferrochelatase/peroxidase EfeB
MSIIKYDREFFRDGDDLEDCKTPRPSRAFSFLPPPKTQLRRAVQHLTAYIWKLLFEIIASLFFRFCRAVCPVPRFRWLSFWRQRRVFVATRAADISAVLGQPDVFGVPYRPDILRVCSGTNSVLGLDGARHCPLNNVLREILGTIDLDGIRAESERIAKALLDNSGGRIDVMSDLITRTITEVACDLFGLDPADPTEFAHWTMSISRLLFADQLGSAVASETALNAGPRLRQVIQTGIARVRDGTLGEGIVALFVALENTPDAMTDDEIIATVMSLLTAIIPATSLAAANILEELLRRPKIFTRATTAAQSDLPDAFETLQRYVKEAGRLRPALAPGVWRYVTAEGLVGQRWYKRRVRPGDVVLAAIPSGLCDRRAFERPHRFDIDRAEEPDLMFGDQSHFCLGKDMALIQITSILRTLLRRPHLCRAGGLDGNIERAGAFPVRLDMHFERDRTRRELITISAPVRDGTNIKTLEEQIAFLRNPALPSVAAALTSTGVIHFASLSVTGSDGDVESPPVIIFEINADGYAKSVLAAVAREGFSWLAPIFVYADPRASEGPDALAQVLEEHSLHLHCFPFGSTGLNFNGMPDFSAEEVARQQALGEFARDALDTYLKGALGRTGRSLDALLAVRAAIRKSRHANDILIPGRRQLAMTGWIPPRGPFGPVTKLFASWSVRALLLILALSWAVHLVSLAAWVDLPMPRSFRSLVSTLIHNHWTVLGVVGGSLVATILLWALALGIFVAVLAWHESRDRPDNRRVDLDDYRERTFAENLPAHAQNHIIAVMPLKLGWFRKLTLGLAMWGVKLSLYWFRPGFVVTMGTIHSARWFRIPRTDRFVFLANYDGSWESYLEDFITRAHQGQTAGWSNGYGFPITRWLYRYGAEDGDRFKRWVRRQQRPALFWYSRFPQMTAGTIRRNALIQFGLARGNSNTDAANWVSCFGSEQRQEGEVETDEVQSLVFSGQPELPFATLVSVRIPPKVAGRARWLRGLTGQEIKWGAIEPCWFEDTEEPISLPKNMRVTFGDRPSHNGATFIAFSEAGLKRAGFPTGDKSDGVDGLASFPSVFRLGMTKRRRILGDRGTSHPVNWAWTDAADSVEAVLLIYGPAVEPDERLSDLLKDQYNDTLARHDAIVDQHIKFVRACGGDAKIERFTGPIKRKRSRKVVLPETEHFGFRDGISQPVIAGTRKAARSTNPRDLVAPGEFILGYRNNQDYFAPPLAVHAFDDDRNQLPMISANVARRFPYFGAPASDTESDDPHWPGNTRDEREYRDFGRNGSWLVIRDLEQHVDRFNDYAKTAANEVTKSYPNLETLIGRKIDGGWIKSRLIGRWPDGTPLVGNPHESVSDRAKRGLGMVGETEPDNDFTYGSDDPRGLQCPLGAHIRRANPRDSFEPNDPMEQTITNRHRILRRGRIYTDTIKRGEKRRGLLFACLCGDIERQFEFIQQSWMNASSFHSLHGEDDPLTSNAPTRPGDQAGSGGIFTIPTPSGAVTLNGMPQFVSVRGGGYFFLPSRSALQFLAYCPPQS